MLASHSQYDQVSRLVASLKRTIFARDFYGYSTQHGLLYESNVYTTYRHQIVGALAHLPPPTDATHQVGVHP